MIDTSYLVSNDAAVRKTQNLDAKLDAAFGTEAEIHAQIAALTDKPADDATWTAPRLQVGKSTSFLVSGTTVWITVYRADVTEYLVWVAMEGRAVNHYTQTWTPERSPDGDARRAAWDYIQSVATDFGGSVKA